MTEITEERFYEMVSELMETTRKAAQEKAKRVWNSGCIEPSQYGDDYQLPKIFMTAFCREMAYQWEPLTKEGKKEAKNMRMFL